MESILEHTDAWKNDPGTRKLLAELERRRAVIFGQLMSKCTVTEDLELRSVMGEYFQINLYIADLGGQSLVDEEDLRTWKTQASC